MEWGGRWKPLQYVVARSFSPLSVFFVGQSTSDESSLWAVNDLPMVATVTYEVYLVPWSQTGDVTRDRMIASNKRDVAGGSSVLLDTIDIPEMLKEDTTGCTRVTCFLLVRATTPAAQGVSIPDSVYYLDLVKNLKLMKNPTFLTSNAKRISDTVIEFDFQVDVTSPFVFLEVTGANDLYTGDRDAGVNNRNAGWFSDNNFLAIGRVSYTLRYTAHEPIQEDVTTFMSLLQIRSLQNVKTTCE